MSNLKRRLPPELRTASVIPRWSVVWTLTRDNVSNHSFFVTFYSREIAKLIQWGGNVGNLMYRAQMHDLEETITGDIVSTVKSEIIDDSRAAAYIDARMVERFPFVMSDMREIAQHEGQKMDDEAWTIVKAADKLDALLFMIGEKRMGNGVIAPHIPRSWNKFEGCWRALPASTERLDQLWNTVIVPAIKDHETNGGFGV